MCAVWRAGPTLNSIEWIPGMGYWSESVTLVAPGFNDSEAELREMTRFIAGVAGWRQRDGFRSMVRLLVSAFDEDFAAEAASGGVLDRGDVLD